METERQRAWEDAARAVAVPRARTTVATALGDADAILRASSGRTGADGESTELLSSLLDTPRSWPALHRDDVLDPLVVAALVEAARRRAAGAPVAYAVGCASFRHLTLDVDERVLIPRPETEMLVDLVLERSGEGGLAVDVGTGSGCIAIALACEGRFDRVIGTDVSYDAVRVAIGNAERCASRLRSPLEFRHGSLLAPVVGTRARVVVSNPPYIGESELTALPADVRDWEPATALLSGAGGMAHTSAIVRAAARVLEGGGLLALEVDSRRASLVAERLAADGRYRDVTVKLDLTGRERFVLAHTAS